MGGPVVHGYCMSEVVFGTGKRGAKYHRTADCPLLTRPSTVPIMEFDPAQVRNLTLCSACFKNQPVLRVMHVRCCSDIVRPCEHNGGVLVFDPSDTYRRMRYAWPEDARKFTIVNPVRVG